MEQKTAYGLITLKSFDEKSRTFKGVASTVSPDRSQDIVEPKGALFKLPIPFLHQHKSQSPVGEITKARVTANGIEVEGHIKDIPDAPPSLKERLDVAWAELKSGLVRGLSIGFNPKEYSFIKETGGIHFTKWEWLELSMVTIAANQEASITSIKAASGQFNRPRQGTSTQGKTMKVYTQESLAALESNRQIKAARMAELLELKSTEDRDFNDEERTEFAGIRKEIANLDDEIAVTQVHVGNIAKASPVDGAAFGQRGAPHVKKYKDVEPKFKGEEGLKRAMAHIISMKELKDGNIVTPAQVFEKQFGRTNPTMLRVMKAAVAGGGTDSGEWGAELASIDGMYTGDFIEYLYGETVFDKLPLRAVPHNVTIKGQDGAFTGYFVGQSKPIKVSKGDFSTTNTTPYKAAGLTVVSNEWLRDATPDGLSLCGEGLRKAVAVAVDTLFLSATGISNGVAPAGILNGTSATASNGGDAQSIATDVKALFAPFITAKNTAGGFVWVMTPTTALALSLMRNALGQPEYPTITPMGGTFQGYPVVTGDNLGTTDIILIKPSDVWKIGDLGVTLSISTEAMIEQADDPTGATDTPVAATNYMVSMFQEDSTAIKVVRPISWGKRRAGCAQYVTDAAYGAEQS